MKKLLIIFSAAVAAFSMSGCNTHKGAWKLAWEENFNQKEHFDTAVWSKIPRGTADWQKHIGKTGHAATILRPSGKVEIDNALFDAVALYGYIEKGAAVKVVKYENAQLYVVETKE